MAEAIPNQENGQADEAILLHRPQEHAGLAEMTDKSNIVDMAGDELEIVEQEDIPEQAELVLKYISEDANSLRKARERAGIGMTRWYDLLRKYPGLEHRYGIACSERASTLAEEAQEIADNCDGQSNSEVQKAKLKVETRKWFASKLDPKKYGEYQRTEMTLNEAGSVAGAAQDLLQLRKKRDKAEADSGVTAKGTVA